MASVTDLYSSLEGYRVRESEMVTQRGSERERRPVSHGEIMLVRYGTVLRK